MKHVSLLLPALVCYLSYLTLAQIYTDVKLHLIFVHFTVYEIYFNEKVEEVEKVKN